MFCPHCHRRVDRKAEVCPHCDEWISQPEGALSSAPLPEEDMRAVYDGEKYTQYYRESFHIPQSRREAHRAQVSNAPMRLTGHGHSLPPPLEERPEPPTGRPGRIHGAGSAPTGPIYVRKPREHVPAHASVQRKVSIPKRGMRLGLVLISVFLLLATVVGVAGYLLTRTIEGQMLTATWGWESAPADAYWRLGENRLRDGDIFDAFEPLLKAYAMDPQNVEGCLLLARAYQMDGRIVDATNIYSKLKEEIAPQHPDAYRQLALMYQAEGSHAQAVAMMEEGLEKTGMETFQTMIREYSPEPPDADPPGQRFKKDTKVTLRSTPGTIIKYVLGAEDDPAGEKGILYEDKPILLTEGTTQIRAVAILEESGVPSKQMSEIYVIVYPKPNAPHANVSGGEYDRQREVEIFPHPDDAKKTREKPLEIRYTLDDTRVTEQSALYTGPIRIPLGRSTLRAVVIDERGKMSNEMLVTYKVKGATKKIFGKTDVFGKLALMKTTYEQFTRTYGEPKSYTKLDHESDTLYRADYDFGYACFIETQEKQLLYELSVESGNIEGPRGITIGTDEEDAIALFRDQGGTASDSGDRVLYKNDDNTLAFYKGDGSGNFGAHYCYRRAVNDYVELAFYFQDGRVSRMHWLRYVGS